MAGKLHSASDGRPLPPGWIEAQDPQVVNFLLICRSGPDFRWAQLTTVA